MTGRREGAARREGADHRDTVADIGEFAVIARSTDRRVHPSSVQVGPGDDCAVLACADGRVVATTDMLVEGRHFRLDWSSHRDVGRKAIAQNAADIAAMGARCTGFLVAMACPAATAVADVDELTAGLWQEAERAGATVIGGDVTENDTLVLSITALGDLNGSAPVLRSGARPGDVVALSAPCGRSAAGYALYDADDSSFPELLAAHRVPEPDYGAGPLARDSGATAMCDVSDGVVGDAAHLAHASRVRIEIESDAIEIPPEMTSAAEHLGIDPLMWSLGGGEDHALLATFPASGAVPDGWRRIGSVTRGTGVVVDGDPWQGSAPWTSF